MRGIGVHVCDRCGHISETIGDHLEHEESHGEE